MSQSPNCIFCNIINGDAPGKLLFEDEHYVVIKDIKPAAKHHYLVIPKKHILNVNSLTTADHKSLLEELIKCGEQILRENGGDVNDSRIGFHIPPFNSVAHLHLHVISPASQMGVLSRLAFKPNTWWFQTTFVLCLSGLQAAKFQQKSSESSESTEKTQKAILAIRIVDPEGEKTNGKNLKRTIESALGYGYQQSAPKYEIYKYSQHDIPAYTGPSLNLNDHTNVGRHQNEYQNNNYEAVNSYQPGTTLFSTINQNGHISALSQQAPTSVGHNGQVPIPVIVLRILPSQLATSTYPLYPNLPLTDNFAPLINSIDVRSLLSKYSSQKQSYQPNPNYKPTPSYELKPIYEPLLSYQIQPNDQTPQNYQSQPHHKSYQPVYNRIPQEFQNPQQSEPIQKLPVQEEPSQVTSYDVVKSHVVHEGSQYEPSNQYLPGNSGNANKELLTHENYPSPHHTRVIFRTPEGQIRKTLESDYEVKQMSKQNDERLALQQLGYTHGSQQQQPQQITKQHQQVDYQYDSNQDYVEQTSQSDQYVYGESPTDKRQNIVYIPFRQPQPQQS